jgi:hypothetical protein
MILNFVVGVRSCKRAKTPLPVAPVIDVDGQVNWIPTIKFYTGFDSVK